MKELSIEEKAKAYDEAIERYKAKQEYESQRVHEFVEYLFPELKESEDERIRKELLLDIPKVFPHDKAFRYIAWLEKQGTPQVRTGIEWVNTIDDACDECYAEEYSHGEYCHEQSFKWGFQEGVEWLEKQGGKHIVDNNETVKPIDKVEPKFKVGDKIRCKLDDRTFVIKEVDLEKGEYLYTKSGCGNDINYADETFELVEQKPAWSEEDEKCLENAIMYCEWARDKAPDLYCYETSEKSIGWLKSLRPQNTWKPSEGQLECLGYAIEKAEKDWSPLINNRIYLTLKALKEQLLELMGSKV